MFARTARLMLRPGWPEDAMALTRAIGHEAVVTKLTRAPWPYALGDAQMFLGQPRTPDVATFLVFDDPTDTPRLVGGIGIDRDGGGGGELGYWFTPEAWGRGYATEAGRAVVDIARHALGLKRLRAGHFADNPASGRVLRKLRFQPTGVVTSRYSAGRRADGASVEYELELVDRVCGDPPMPLAA